MRLNLDAVIRSRQAQRAGRAVLMAVLIACLCACGPGEKQVDLSATDAAVMDASSRIVSIEESNNAVNGLGTDVYYELRLSSKRPVSVEALDAIVEAIWLNLPFEPNSIQLIAFTDDAQETAVDLRKAASGLQPARAQAYGQGGVSIIGLQQRYGEWKKP